ALVNNAGIYSSNPFTQYTAEDFRSLAKTNLEGFLHTTQLVIKQLLEQKKGGSIVNITASLADQLQAGLPSSVPIIAKGGLKPRGIKGSSRNVALEYAREAIRLNVVAPGVVDTPLLKGVPQDFLRSLSPMGQVGTSQDIAEAVFYLTEARQVTGEILHVD